MKPIRIFIGYDKKEVEAFHVLSHSIVSRASVPVTITALIRAQLKGVHSRQREAAQSNDFSFTRFLVPYLCGYDGWAIFMDCDMLCRGDINDLWEVRSSPTAVQVVKHDYDPKYAIKYLGNKQSTYRCKNWSSMMLFNCDKCIALTPDYVNTATGLDLHQFKWAQGGMVGGLPATWNHLVEEYPQNSHAKIAHFTNFGPWLRGHEHVEFGDEWRREREAMLWSEQ